MALSKVITHFLQVLICLEVVLPVWWWDGRKVYLLLDALVLLALLNLILNDKDFLCHAVCDILLLRDHIVPELQVDVQASDDLDLAILRCLPRIGSVIAT